MGSTTTAARCGVTAPTGFTLTPGDCCDTDPRVKPGQTSYFDTARVTCGGFDFDCSGADEPEAAGVMACPMTPPCDCANGTGWATPVAPACGVAGPKVLASQCSASLPSACMPPKCSIAGQAPMTVLQTCR